MRPWQFAAFLAMALGACFPQILSGTESFFSRDYGTLAYPTIHFHRESFWRGEIPLWNPYSHSGVPFLAQWGTMVLYPLSLIYLLLPLPWSLSFFCFIHVWLGGIGMYLLVRHWTRGNFAGAMAGTLYVFNGVMFASFVWPNYLVTLGWMPFVVLLAERAWREGGRWVMSCAVVAALQMLSGAPEVILITWLVAGCLCGFDMARAPRGLVRFSGRMLFVAALTTGLAAAQLGPFFELFTYSHRDAGFAATRWELPLWGWANFLVPLYNAFETPMGQYYQYGQGFLSSVYLGGMAISLSVVALFNWPDRRVWVLCFLAGMSVVLAFGANTGISGAMQSWFPFLGMARYPVKFVFVLAFVIPLLAGCGVAAIFQARRPAALYGPAILVLVAMFGIMWAAQGHRFVDYQSWPQNFRQNVDFSWKTTLPGQPWPEAVGNTIARAVLFVAVLGFFRLAVRGKIFSPLFAVVALALIAVDVKTHTPLQNPSLPVALLTRTYWLEDVPKPKLGDGRVFITPEAEDFLTFVSGTNTQRIWEIKRRAEWSNLNLLDGVPKVNGASTLQIREQRAVEQTLYAMTNRLPAGLLDFLGVSHITGSNLLARPWLRRGTSLPLVTAGQKVLFAETSEAFATITNNGFDPRQVVILPASARSVVRGDLRLVNATVSSVSFKPQSVEAVIDTPETTLAVIAQSHYPAWRSTVDGVATPLLRANFAFQALVIPAGQHRIRIFYSDATFRRTSFISLLSLLGCVVLWLKGGRSGG